MKKEGSTASMLWLDIRRGFCSKRFWGIVGVVTIVFVVFLTLFRETYHSVTSRFFSNNTCWKLIFAIHFISPTRLNKILFFYCIIMHYPV